MNPILPRDPQGASRPIPGLGSSRSSTISLAIPEAWPSCWPEVGQIAGQIAGQLEHFWQFDGKGLVTVLKMLDLGYTGVVL